MRLLLFIIFEVKFSYQPLISVDSPLDWVQHTVLNTLFLCSVSFSRVSNIFLVISISLKLDKIQVTSKKKSIRHNLPIQIGFFVYSYAKLRMLSFYFDVLVRYIPRPFFSLCEMDTGKFESSHRFTLLSTRHLTIHHEIAKRVFLFFLCAGAKFFFVVSRYFARTYVYVT